MKCFWSESHRSRRKTCGSQWEGKIFSDVDDAQHLRGVVAQFPTSVLIAGIQRHSSGFGFVAVELFVLALLSFTNDVWAQMWLPFQTHSSFEWSRRHCCNLNLPECCPWKHAQPQLSGSFLCSCVFVCLQANGYPNLKEARWGSTRSTM